MRAFRSVSVSTVLCLISTVVCANPSAQSKWLQDQLQGESYSSESSEVLAKRAQVIQRMQQMWNQNPGYGQHSSLLPGVVSTPVQQQAPARTAVEAESERTKAADTSASAPLPKVTDTVQEQSNASTDAPIIEITNATLEPQVAQQAPQQQKSTQQQQAPVRYLQWNTPAKRLDGSTFLSKELGGYFIIVKNKTTGGTSQVHISDPNMNSYSLRNYRRGSYSFSIQSYDLRGLVSPYSPWVNVTI